ncbi:MAG TPA: hypothetical protein VN719_01255 [Gemmatimonadales bacterium]|nr:hypothetical protein [Gemmatimonadales bacterium]
MGPDQLHTLWQDTVARSRCLVTEALAGWSIVPASFAVSAANNRRTVSSLR